MPNFFGLQEVSISSVFAGAGTNLLVTAVAGKNIQVVKFFLTISAATTIQFLDGATPLTGVMTMAVGTPLVVSESYAGIPWMTAVGNLNLAAGAAATVSGRLIYTQE